MGQSGLLEDALSLQSQIVEDLNLLARFLSAPSDLPAKADLLIVLGSALPVNATYGAQLFHEGRAPKVLISGGIGHSTPLLWANLEEQGIEAEDRAEAEIYHDLMVGKYAVPKETILLESMSTNCGANATESKKLLERQGINPKSIILVQDPTMQLRSYATFKHVFPESEVFSAPPFIPTVTASGLDNECWSFDRFLELLLGEIPRFELYGPKGRGFIIQIQVPDEVQSAWARLAELFPDHIRGMV